MDLRKALVRTFVGLMVPMGLAVAETNTTTGNTAGPGHMGQHLIKALGLTSDQTTQFQQMLQQHVAAMKAEKERFEAQVNGILTADQQAKFKELTQKRAEHMKGFRDGGHRWGGGFMGGLKELNLTADQQAQVKTIMQDMRTKLAAAAPGDRVARKQIWEDSQTQITKILTPDQLTQWNQLKQTRQAHRGGKACPNPSPSQSQ